MNAESSLSSDFTDQIDTSIIKYTALTKATWQGWGVAADLLIGEVWGEQFQGVGNGDGGPGLHEVCSLAGLLGIPPVHALQKLGQGSRLADQAVAEAPQHRSLLNTQRPDQHSMTLSPCML